MCKSALQALGPHLASKDIQKLFEEQLVPSSPLNFQDFVATLSKKLVSLLSLAVLVLLALKTSVFHVNIVSEYAYNNSFKFCNILVLIRIKMWTF